MAGLGPHIEPEPENRSQQEKPALPNKACAPWGSYCKYVQPWLHSPKPFVQFMLRPQMLQLWGALCYPGASQPHNTEQLHVKPAQCSHSRDGPVLLWPQSGQARHKAELLLVLLPLHSSVFKETIRDNSHLRISVRISTTKNLSNFSWPGSAVWSRLCPSLKDRLSLGRAFQGQTAPLLLRKLLDEIMALSLQKTSWQGHLLCWGLSLLCLHLGTETPGL